MNYFVNKRKLFRWWWAPWMPAAKIGLGPFTVGVDVDLDQPYGIRVGASVDFDRDVLIDAYCGVCLFCITFNLEFSLLWFMAGRKDETVCGTYK